MIVDQIGTLIEVLPYEDEDVSGEGDGVILVGRRYTMRLVDADEKRAAYCGEGLGYNLTPKEFRRLGKPRFVAITPMDPELELTQGFC
ncbi:MAG: hypothetical protein HYW25_00440 [Candidatus Aenigmarchaeota archaeon]|nr:hypothetical protein [Candidatus Aenigmarchaeota archaeon]